jgi:hypothetical protein
MACAKKGHLAMRYSSRFFLRSAVGLLLGALALTGCTPGAGTQTAAQATPPRVLLPPGGGANPPPWMFVWAPPGGGGISQSVDLATAYAEAGKVIHNQDNPQPPAATTWLTTGPAFGMAVVQLDSAGTYFNLVTVEVDPPTHAWMGSGASLLPSSDCGGSATATDGPLTFPAKVCQAGTGGKYSTASRPARFAYTWWAAGTSVFILYRWNPIDLRPTADATTVTIGGHPGWLTTHQAYTSVVLRTKSDETILFAGTAAPAVMQKLTAEALPDLDNLVPLLSGPPTPPGLPPTPPGGVPTPTPTPGN